MDWDFQDFSKGRRSSVFVLAGFAVMAKMANWAKRNPENPDSDKAALSLLAQFGARVKRKTKGRPNNPIP